VQLREAKIWHEILSAFLQQNPNDPGARARLDEIRKLEKERRK
jgi:hypothetical protein